MRAVIGGFLAFGIFVLATSVSAQQPTMKISDLTTMASNSREAMALLQGAALGLEGMYGHFRANNMRLLYCPPDKLAITGEQYQSILASYIDKNPGRGELDVGLLGWVLLQALIETFPCR